jgi:hypothetical protein
LSPLALLSPLSLTHSSALALQVRSPRKKQPPARNSPQQPPL